MSWSTSELRVRLVPLNRFKPSSKCIFTDIPRRCFFCGSFMFLFWLVFAMFWARLFICALWSPAGKGLTSWLSFVVSTVSLSLSHWYPGSGMVLGCIDSWSLHHYLLLQLPLRTFTVNRWLYSDTYVNVPSLGGFIVTLEYRYHH